MDHMKRGGGLDFAHEPELANSRASLTAQLVKNPPAMQETPVQFPPGSGRAAGEGIGYPLQYSWACLVAQLVKNLPAIRFRVLIFGRNGTLQCRADPIMSWSGRIFICFISV